MTPPRKRAGKVRRMWAVTNGNLLTIVPSREAARDDLYWRLGEPGAQPKAIAFPVAVVPLDHASYEAMVSKLAKYLGGIRFDPDNYGDADGLARAVLRSVLGAPAKA